MVIVALSGFCAPAYTMWQGAWNLTKEIVQQHPYVSAIGALGCVGVGCWQYLTYKKVNLSQYILDYTDAHTPPRPEFFSVRATYVCACAEYVDDLIKALEETVKEKNFDVDARSKYSGTALFTAFYSSWDHDNKLAAWLLKKGASVGQCCAHGNMPPESHLSNMINHMYDWKPRYDVRLVQLMQNYDDLQFFARGARESEIATWESVFGKHKIDHLLLLSYSQWIAQKEMYTSLQENQVSQFVHMSCRFKNHIDNITHIVSLAPPTTDWVNVLDKPLLHMLCTGNNVMIKKCMPLIARDVKLKHMFLDHCEKFDCREYQVEAKKILWDEQQELFRHGLLTNKNTVDVYWCFK